MHARQSRLMLRVISATAQRRPLLDPIWVSLLIWRDCLLRRWSFCLASPIQKQILLKSFNKNLFPTSVEYDYLEDKLFPLTRDSI